MANLLKDGLSFLTAQMQQYASEPVTYTRGVDSVLVLAVFGRKLLRLDDGMGGTRLEWTDLDFLIAADADFAFTDGLPITPARDDSVWILVPGGTEEFRVVPFGPSEPPWRWADPHQSMYRIHTKHVSTDKVILR